jgi:hypothetical protein
MSGEQSDSDYEVEESIYEKKREEAFIKELKETQIKKR